MNEGRLDYISRIPRNGPRSGLPKQNMQFGTVR